MDAIAGLVTPRRFGLVFGTALAALGVVGFAVTGAADPLRDHGATVLGLGVNPAANLLHIGTGVGLTLAATWGAAPARHGALSAASAFLILAGFGYALAGTENNLLGVNGATSTLYLITGLVAAAAARPRHDRATSCHDGSEPPGESPTTAWTRTADRER